MSKLSGAAAISEHIDVRAVEGSVEGRGQRADGRGQRAESREQRAESR